MSAKNFHFSYWCLLILWVYQIFILINEMIILKTIECKSMDYYILILNFSTNFFSGNHLLCDCNFWLDTFLPLAVQLRSSSHPPLFLIKIQSTWKNDLENFVKKILPDQRLAPFIGFLPFILLLDLILSRMVFLLFSEM